jgi:hypothetical protein
MESNYIHEFMGLLDKAAPAAYLSEPWDREP